MVVHRRGSVLALSAVGNIRAQTPVRNVLTDLCNPASSFAVGVYPNGSTYIIICHADKPPTLRSVARRCSLCCRHTGLPELQHVRMQ